MACSSINQQDPHLRSWCWGASKHACVACSLGRGQMRKDMRPPWLVLIQISGSMTWPSVKLVRIP